MSITIHTCKLIIIGNDIEIHFGYVETEILH